MLEYNYRIILFKNKEKKKIINKFITEKRALKLFNTLSGESEQVIFEMKFENGSLCDYELGIVEVNYGPSQPMFIRDEFGRQVKIELENTEFKISRICKYRIEEEFLDYETKKKINTKTFIKKYLSKDGLKMLSKLNNKIVLQNDDSFNLFTFKNNEDSERFIDTLSELFIKEKRMDCIFVKDISTAQRKYLYEILITKGFPKKYLFRLSTTHPK
jgi:hypothetical protein